MSESNKQDSAGDDLTAMSGPTRPKGVLHLDTFREAEHAAQHPWSPSTIRLEDPETRAIRAQLSQATRAATNADKNTDEEA
ncbi:hypothetical protein HY604_02125 [Candidatus Peregrinibacteria bacterium]|nr:hypothetical protein [Candidatus Peregrinibacteria bacterium]